MTCEHLHVIYLARHSWLKSGWTMGLEKLKKRRVRKKIFSDIMLMKKDADFIISENKIE